MDGYKKFFYASTHVYEFKRATFNEKEKASVQKRIDLRRSLKCESFDWYMYNFVPELETPPMDAVYYGEIMNMKSRACFEVQTSGYIGVTYNCYEHKIIPKNYFSLNRQGLLQFQDKCVALDGVRPILYLAECPGFDATDQELEEFGMWRLVNRGHVWGQLKVNMTTKDGNKREWCVSQVSNVLEVHKGEQMPQLTSCKKDDGFQVWTWTYKFDFIV